LKAFVAALAVRAGQAENGRPYSSTNQRRDRSLLTEE
jgi:hypothetical protein